VSFSAPVPGSSSDGAYETHRSRATSDGVFPRRRFDNRATRVPSRPGSGHGSAVAVDVGSVVDAQDLDPVSGVVDVVEDPVRASTGAVGAFEFSLERLADLSGCPREVAEDELDDRRNDSWRDAAQVPARGGREDHLITHRSPLGTLNSARICSSL